MIKDVRNYWYPGSPLGGYNQFSQKNGGPSATNIERYLAPLITPRLKQDTLTWKQALQEAEIPLPLLSYRYKIQQMYMDSVNDAHVWACIERRKDLVLRKDFHIVDENDKEDEVATKIIQNSWFKEIISHVLDARYYGYTLLGLGNIVNGKFDKINLLRRQNVSPDRLNLQFVPYSPGGIQFMDPQDVDDEGRSFYDWTIWIPTQSDFGISSCGYGLLYKVALYQILLRNNLGDNATYNELFGQPTRIGKTEKKDKPSRDRFADTLDTMGSTAWALLDKDDEIEFRETSGGSGRANGTYDNFEQRLEKKISKIILGHEDALASTPGKLGSTGKETDGSGKALIDKEKNDTDFAENSINDYVYLKLAKLGFKLPMGKKFKFKNDSEKIDERVKEDTNNSATATMAKTFSDAGLTVDPAYITERTGVPLTKTEGKEPLINNPNVTEKTLNKIKNYYGG